MKKTGNWNMHAYSLRILQGVHTVPQCTGKCLEESKCKGFTYHDKTCTLINTTAAEAGQNFTKEDTHVAFYEKVSKSRLSIIYFRYRLYRRELYTGETGRISIILHELTFLITYYKKLAFVTNCQV